jgi:peptidoglycan/LPS O-acetylase OafA/YrhL
VSLSRFYRRRALRLLPALMAMLVVVGALTVLGVDTLVTPGLFAAVFAYFGNWYLLSSPHWSAIGHTWSLAIEEQFYVLWPLVVILAARWGRRAVLVASIVGAEASLLWWGATGRSTLDTGVSAWCLFAGCALAAVMHGTAVRQRPSSWPAALSLLVLVPLVPTSGPVTAAVGHVLAPLAACGVIWIAVQRPVRWLESPWLLWLGRRSYGLYLWHVPVAYVLSRNVEWWQCVAIGVPLSLLLTAVSWRCIEQPFLRLKRAPGSSRVAPNDPVPGLAGAR